MADVVINSALFITSTNAVPLQGTAGATINRGQPVYLDSGSGTYKLAQANNTNTDSFAGLAMEDVAAGQQVLICVKDVNLQLGATMANGDRLYLSGNAGAMTKTEADLASGWRIWLIGICNGANNSVNFVPVKGAIK